MWPSIARILNNPNIVFAPLAIWLFFLIAMLFFLAKSPTYRNTVSYNAVVAALAGTVASVFPILNVYGIFRSLPAFPIFYGIYSAFTYVPAIIAFHTLEKKTKISETGKYSIFLGFVWAAVCILAGLAVTIMAAICDAQGSVDLAWIQRFANGMSFLLLMGWGFIAVNLLLLMAYLRHLNGGSARISFVTYTILNIISAVAFTVLAFSPLVTDYTFFDVYGYLNVFLVDFPTVVAVFIVFYMGHLWMDNDENAVVNEA